MKDYYSILGVPEDADIDQVRTAFRRLAFQYHPDKNPGNEKESGERFKEINEAYTVLCDEARRREYDACRKGGFAGVGGGARGFDYTQDEILRSAFASQNLVQELNRMFAQMGLRFDENFLNRVFFSGKGFRFEFRMGPGGVRRGYYHYGGQQPSENGLRSTGIRQPVVRKPSLAERMIARAIGKLAAYALKKSLDIRPALPPRGNDIYKDLKISPKEAASGCLKKVRYRRGKEKKTLEVTIPAGIESGMKIKLKGMGEHGEEPGDLYLQIGIK
ncbi:MAG: hypothetical protein FJZ95_04355 [Chloroflexi bacterium]|nr:hypothetical protein [Chloroflexota bacterium]